MDSVVGIAPVIPVVVVEDADDAVPLARALLAGGLGAIEITLRTPAALEAIQVVAHEVPEAVVGAGTVLTPDHAAAAAAAGARFLVSPGWTERLLDAMCGTGLPYLPGVSTPSEVIDLLDRGVTDMKFFPAEAAGGVPFLRSLASPLPRARFCPTGGIDAARAPHYLALPNVACVGGSWMLPKDLLAARNWEGVTALAKEAAGLAPAAPRS
ncbi:bifunctional 4-hydroxy-2-oxoglutarate aldolase/2-dehydro-3-deoxy-phosphogluconate aldolase [Actinacidiphila bryophytorum]|uniref:2-dehydro-3-deoxy-phosphogluconate aldolase n=1 Tax=Actinacidiphila bryophytorum TaxID=1436133 RepID=A0A9W4EDT9_9ACTN|nr:bifunctional 4-hydroxy-2-oxoglutarate aldolase/2-dehydro-3-deoxy-phosphogluconate aldolase [Actinacidiphila bryophytorum]MBM9434773.1 bifunctional 4-hydroxy-2-oxoglutarate aldolase/2-dehydro-3-deoxy-phosphogluconate aldolase [Actinacidiphila bryophytorum]MBN6547061.1 bifunctional 4-hydroxy-2-oxoglutarate aldolase/2-dehydro-3-deoxy-phosphogluconate aldolase [Actinacidiphila bryophytorum]CAG7629979.1 KHG/KDPG aldolase [Actinacidiphila bryophytorum]